MYLAVLILITEDTYKPLEPTQGKLTL